MFLRTIQTACSFKKKHTWVVPLIAMSTKDGMHKISDQIYIYDALAEKIQPLNKLLGMCVSAKMSASSP